MRSIVAAFLFFLVAGCANQQIQQLQARQYAQQQESQAIMDDLVRQLSSNQALDPIRGKVYLGRDIRETPLSLLALPGTPTPPEQAALEAWQQWAVSTAYPRLDQFYKANAPWVISILQLQRAAYMSLLAELYTGSITYGQFNKRKLELVTNGLAAIQQRQQELQTMATQEAQAQAIATAQRSMATSAALQSYFNFLQSQQLINQQFQPARIAPFTCTQYGNRTNCF